MEKLKMHSVNKVDENVVKIGKLFPNCLTERMNENGEVEIGYGLGKEFEHNGYMTETVKALSNWALEQSKVKNIIAETDINGYASQNILKRCGFKEYKRKDTSWWKL